MQIEIPIEFINLQDRGYHIAVRCKVNEFDNLLLLIDTGASNSVFDIEHIAFSKHEVNPVPEEIISSGFNSEIEKIFLGKIEDLVLGDIQITFNPALFTSLSHVNSVYTDLDIERLSGIIGGDFLRKHSAVIDYESGILKIKNM